MLDKKAGMLIFVCDIAALFAAFFVSELLARYVSTAFIGNEREILGGYLTRINSYLPISLAILLAFYNRGYYSRRIPWWNQVRYFFIVLIIALGVEGFIFFAVKIPFSRLWVLFSWATAFALFLIARKFAIYIANKCNIWKKRTIIIGNGNNLIDAVYAMYSERDTGYDVTDIIVHNSDFKIKKNELPSEYANLKKRYIKNITALIKKERDAFIIIAHDSFDELNIDEIVDILNKNNVQYAIVPPLKGFSLYGERPQYFFGHDIVLLQPRYNIVSPTSRLLKRAVDILCSCFALLFCIPIFMFIAFAVKRDGGSAFYSQIRIGKDGKEFKFWKFRSMKVDAEKALEEILASNPKMKADWDVKRKLSNDPRITKIGKFLRKSSLDELPQLLNVLVGQMSLVGPRPILPDEVIFFTDMQLKIYYSAKPGITGLWQVSGRNETVFKHRVHLDCWYVRNWSLWHDIVILFKTVGVVLKRGGAY